MTDQLKVVPEFSPEQIETFKAEMRAKFSADDLFGYIEESWEGPPAAEVLAKGDEIIRRKRRERAGVK